MEQIAGALLSGMQFWKFSVTMILVMKMVGTWNLPLTFTQL